MEHAKIENEARRLQFEIWNRRQIIAPSGASPLQLFRPDIAAGILDYEQQQGSLTESVGLFVYRLHSHLRFKE
jgi:hypothetical protein